MFLNTTLMVSPTAARITGPSIPRVSSHTRAVGAQEVGRTMGWVKDASVYPLYNDFQYLCPILLGPCFVNTCSSAVNGAPVMSFVSSGA